MTKRARNPLLEPFRISTGPQKIEIVVALEHKSVASRKRRFDVRGRSTDICKYAQAECTVRNDVLHRLPSIVRHGVRVYLDVADRESGAAVDEVDAYCAGSVTLAGFYGGAPRAVREPYRQAVLRGECEHAADVVVVLMGDDDRTDVGRRKAEAREPPRSFAWAETAVEKKPRTAHFGHQTVALEIWVLL